jgi:hypothetical protein
VVDEPEDRTLGRSRGGLTTKIHLSCEQGGQKSCRCWAAEDGSARFTVEVVAEQLGPSLRWATATTTRTTRS